MDTVTEVQILYKGLCISDRANTLGEVMNPTNPSPATGK